MEREEVKHFLIHFLKEKKLYKKFMKNFGHWEIREDYNEDYSKNYYNSLPKNIDELCNDEPKYWIGSAFAWEIDDERKTWGELSYEWETLIRGLENKYKIAL